MGFDGEILDRKEEKSAGYTGFYVGQLDVLGTERYMYGGAS